jgi:hypothetical protein
MTTDQQTTQEDSQEDSEQPETFPRAYVEELRTENRQRRQEAQEASQRADYLATEVRRLATREAVRGILTDPESLPWAEEFSGEDGLPDQARITAAAEALALEKPWLGRPRGDVGQGEHSQAEPFNIQALFRT